MALSTATAWSGPLKPALARDGALRTDAGGLRHPRSQRLAAAASAGLGRRRRGLDGHMGDFFAVGRDGRPDPSRDPATNVFGDLSRPPASRAEFEVTRATGTPTRPRSNGVEGGEVLPWSCRIRPKANGPLVADLRR